MAALNVDLVFVIDTSESMQPCFDALRTHLDEIIKPLQGHASSIRFGLVAQSAGSIKRRPIYDHQFLCGSGLEVIRRLYQNAPNDSDPENAFFTSDPRILSSALAALSARGNEEMLVALDVAADFPFGAIANTKRVIALFSDESFEGGVSVGALNAKIPELSQKLMNRHIQLFVAIPDSPAVQELAQVDRSEIELVDGGGGLGTVNFQELLAQMGKSISGSSLQMAAEPSYRRAIFGQDSWDEHSVAGVTTREQISKAGEVGGMQITAKCLGVVLDVSPSMSLYLPSLRAQIGKSFPEAQYRQVEGCRLAGTDVFSELMTGQECDAIYWFCDLQDGGDRFAIRELRNLLVQNQVRLYVRSLDKLSDGYPGLKEAIIESGGELRRGSVHELMAVK